MSTSASKAKSVKAIREEEEKANEKVIREKCETWAVEKFGDQQVKSWSNEHKGLFYLPILDEEDNVEFCLILKPVTRQLLSYASTKLSDDGLYAYLETCMRECFVAGDEKILDEEEYFIPAANQFNKIIDGKKAALVKR